MSAVANHAGQATSYLLRKVLQVQCAEQSPDTNLKLVSNPIMNCDDLDAEKL